MTYRYSGIHPIGTDSRMYMVFTNGNRVNVLPNQFSLFAQSIFNGLALY